MIPLALVLLAASPISAQEWKTITAARSVTGEDAVSVEVAYGAGAFTLSKAESGRLYRLSLRYDQADFEPVTEYSHGQLKIGIRSRRSGSVTARRAGSLDLKLSPDLPLDLSLELGAVTADVDLTGLALSGLSLSTGASESTIRMDVLNPIMMEKAEFTIGAADIEIRGLGNLNAREIAVGAGVGKVTLYLDGAWPQSAKMEIDVGVGALNLRVPEGLGVRIQQTSFLASIRTQGMVKRGNAYYTDNWERADQQVDIEISAALGSVDVSTIR